MQERFADWLQAQLERRGVEGVTAAARELGVSQSMISNWLNGHTLPARKSVRALARALETTPAEIDAVLLAEDARRRGNHVPGLGPVGETGEGASGYIVETPAARVRLTDPRAVSYFYGFLRRYERMTEEERDSLLADEVDIPERAAPGGDGDAGGGAGGARGAGEARD